MMFLLHQFLDSKSLLGQNCSTSITKQITACNKRVRPDDLLRRVLIDVQTCKGAWPGPSWRLYPRRMQRNWLAQSPIRKVPITPSFRPSVNLKSYGNRKASSGWNTCSLVASTLTPPVRQYHSLRLPELQPE